MPAGPRRRRRTTGSFNVLIVPEGDGAGTRSFRLRPWVLVLAALTGVAMVAALTLLLVVHTPAGRYLPIPNPEMELRYGKRIAETQEQLAQLAEDVLVLKDYNLQLRKALGERVGDSVRPPRPASVRTPDTLIADAGLPQVPGGAGAFPAGSAPPPAGGPYGALVSGAAGKRVSFPLLVPAEGYVSQQFDPARGHFGLDVASRTGATVVAAAEGYVFFSGWTYEDGYMLVLTHGEGYATVYKHAQTLLRPAHVRVRRGEPIATVGTTGVRSGGPHLHFEVWRDGTPEDPREYLLNLPAAQ